MADYEEEEMIQMGRPPMGRGLGPRRLPLGSVERLIADATPPPPPGTVEMPPAVVMGRPPQREFVAPPMEFDMRPPAPPPAEFAALGGPRAPMPGPPPPAPEPAPPGVLTPQELGPAVDDIKRRVMLMNAAPGVFYRALAGRGMGTSPLQAGSEATLAGLRALLGRR